MITSDGTSLSFSVIGAIRFGCRRRETLLRTSFRQTRTRTHLMPPEVEEEQPPKKNRQNKIMREKVGQRS